MTGNGWLQILVYSLVLLLITKPLGIYILNVYDGSFFSQMTQLAFHNFPLL
jgi:K+-transporting ATPase A subunit